MKRIVTAIVLSVVLVGSLVSMAAAVKDKSSSQVPDLEGKTILVMFGSNPFPLTPTDNPSIRLVGEREFLVIPSSETDEPTFDRWVPLESVTSLMVFDNMEEAVKYRDSRYMRRRGSRPDRANEDGN